MRKNRAGMQARAAVCAATYPDDPPPTNKIAVCFSGGGSRALTCALGQLSALSALPDATDADKTVMDRIDYLSSVSGGSWASVAYTFLPEHIADEEFLITPTAPGELRLTDPHTADAANVAYLAPQSLGIVPTRFDVDTIAETLWTMARWGLFGNREKWRWLWPIAIGEIVLRPFGLYEATYRRRKLFNEPKHFFAPSESYVRDEILPHNPELNVDDFLYERPGRTPLFVNFNIMQDEGAVDPAQLPVQASSSCTGALGATPDDKLVGGGSVQTFAFTSTLTGRTSEGSALVEVDRRWSLSDMAGCSSAFFAEFILQYLNQEIDKIERTVVELVSEKLRLRVLGRLVAWFVRRRIEPVLDTDAKDLVPAYNYWPVSAVEGPTTAPEANSVRGFSDGGDFDNTGILGALARTDADRIVSFVNSENPLSRNEKGSIRATGALAQLFGYRPKMEGGEWVTYGGMRPEEPLSYVQVFSDDGEAFAALLKGLMTASEAGGSKPGRGPAAFRQELVTVENPVAHVNAGRKVTVLWVYNNRVDEWQDQITDTEIASLLRRGQDDNEGPLAHFPWYETAGQIHLEPEAVNLLAQLSAWNVQAIAPQLYDLIAGDFAA